MNVGDTVQFHHGRTAFVIEEVKPDGIIFVSKVLKNGIRLKMCNPVHICDVAPLGAKVTPRDKTSKMGQWTRIEKSIRSVLPIMGSRICCYRMFQGDTKEFAPGSETIKALVACIQSFLAY